MVPAKKTFSTDTGINHLKYARYYIDMELYSRMYHCAGKPT